MTTLSAKLAGSRTIREALERVGLDEPARRALRVVSPLHRRDAQDDRNLARLLAHSLAVDANCVDVGANRGDFVDLCVRLAPDGTHHAFEPLPDLAAGIRARHPGVVVHELALADAPGTATYSRPVGADGLSGLSDRGLRERYEIEHLQVRVARLDDVLPADYVPSFLKIDVEGAELRVLEGAAETLERHHPIIWFEHGHVSSGYFGAGPRQVWDLLARRFGYRIFNADGDGPLDREQFFTGPGRPMWSYVAHR